MNRPEQLNEESLKAPERLVTELKRVSSAKLFIPPTIDDAVLLASRRALQPGAAPRFFRFRLVPWLTAAAAVLVLVLFVLVRPATHRSMTATGDVNGDGRTEILDAFILARELKAGAHPGPGLDVNGDGLVDERDVLTVAARAVELQKGGG